MIAIESTSAVAPRSVRMQQTRLTGVLRSWVSACCPARARPGEALHLRASLKRVLLLVQGFSEPGVRYVGGARFQLSLTRANERGNGWLNVWAAW
jgi:hypothetical protein